MRKNRTKAFITDGEMLKVWKGAWEESDGKNPYSMKINKAMLDAGFGIHDVKTRLGVVMSIPVKERTDDQRDLLDFDRMARECAESALVDQCGSSVNGAIFLLEAKYGYRKGTDINITADKDIVKKVVKWGDDEGGDLSVDSGENVAANG